MRVFDQSLPPMRLDLYDQEFNRICQIGSFRTLSVTVRHGSAGSGVITVDLDHPRLVDLMTLGTRAVVDLFVGSTRADYFDESKWIRLMSGPLNSVTAAGPLGESDYVNVTIADDWSIMSRVLAWPAPLAAIGAQTVENDERTGPAETVVKGLISDNVVSRLGLPFTVAADQGRGADITTSARFDTIADLVADSSAAAGIGVSFTQSGASVVVDAYEPVDRSARVVFGAPYGNVTDWMLTRSDPTGTRAVIGGDGDGTSQVLSTAVDPSGEETSWGTVCEVYLDGTGTDTAALTSYGLTQLASTQSGTAVDASTIEVPAVRFGVHYWVGDTVAVWLTDDLQVTEQVSEVTVTWNSDEGLQVTPQIGDTASTQTPSATLAAAISRLGRGVRRMRTRR